MLIILFLLLVISSTLTSAQYSKNPQLPNNQWLEMQRGAGLIYPDSFGKNNAFQDQTDSPGTTWGFPANLGQQKHEQNPPNTAQVDLQRQRKISGNSWQREENQKLVDDTNNQPLSLSSGKSILQNPQTQNQFYMPAPIIPLNGPSRAIDRFETNTPRFATAPPPGSLLNRIVLPESFIPPALQNGVLSEKFTPDENIKNPVSLIDYGNKAPTWTESGNQPNKIQWNTDQAVQSLTDLTARNALSEPKFWQFTTNSNTYDPKNNVPKLPNFAHEDLRPATGDRLGTQWKYGGGTNEYREDLGRIFTRPEIQQPKPWESVTTSGHNQTESVSSPVSRFLGSGINPLPKQMIGGEEDRKSSLNNVNFRGQSGRIVPYINAPEEITRSRYRSLDEYWNSRQGNVNSGRSQQNRFVKMSISSD